MKLVRLRHIVYVMGSIKTIVGHYKNICVRSESSDTLAFRIIGTRLRLRKSHPPHFKSIPPGIPEDRLCDFALTN